MTETTYATAAAEAAPSPFARIAARLGARHLDRLVMAGVSPRAGSALHAHMSRLSSTECRAHVAVELRRRGTLVLCDRVMASSRINPAAVWDAADLIERAEKRLLSDRAVSPRGVARLRRLLADWNGPLRRVGAGDLRSELRAALAAL
jgi:hypothetical protein